MSTSTSAAKKRAIKRQQIKSSPVWWMRYNRRHPNDPRRNYDFRNNDGDPLNYLLDDESHMHPDQWANINVLLMARGCLKTTSVIGITDWACDTIPNFELFMSAPSQSQVDEFMDKFIDSVRDTPLEDKRNADGGRNKRKHQKFASQLPTDDGTVTTFSHVKAKSAWNADEGMRGPHSHGGVLDEFQDVSRQAFETFIEIIDQSIPDRNEFPVIFIIGTPKLKNTFFHRMWKMSNQRTWDADENEWVEQSEIGEFGPDGVDDSFTVKGWHIDQPNSPLHSEGEIAFKRENNTEKKFKNEVLAQFYTPEDDLLSERDIKAIYDDDRGWRSSRLYDDSDVIITVDWGGGQDENAADTVVTVGEKIDIGEHDEDFESDDHDYKHIIHQNDFLDKSLSKTEEEAEVRAYISRFDPELVLVDEGHSGRSRETLQSDFPDIVRGVNFGNVKPSEKIKWKKEEDTEKKLFCTVDKVYNCEKAVDTIRDGKFVLPSKDLNFGSRHANGNKLLSHLTATYKDQKTTTTGRKKMEIKSDRNDDAFDTWVYQYIGVERLNNGPGLMDFSMNDMRGY